MLIETASGAVDCRALSKSLNVRYPPSSALSASRLAQLLSDPPEGKAAPKPAAVKRKLKELSLFRGPATLVVLTWEDLDADVALVSSRSGRDVVVGNATDAHEVGLAALLVPTEELDRSELEARLRSLPRHGAMTLVRHDIHWDGSSFEIDIETMELEAGTDRLEL